jgi:alpha-aminoadipate/glutamate carrier protein LysW
MNQQPIFPAADSRLSRVFPVEPLVTTGLQFASIEKLIQRLDVIGHSLGN